MRTVLGAVALLLAGPAAARAQTPVDDALLVRRIAEYVTPFAQSELSGTLLVARGGKILVEQAFGFADYEQRTPFRTDTPTGVASITKPLTIIIAGKLMDAGKLSRLDTVARWLPEYVHGKRMTVAQLLSHQAGVPHRLLPEDEQHLPRTAEDMVRLANGHQLLFEPGARSSYSSGGYAVLARILEKAGGADYDALLQTFVAQPAGGRTIRHGDSQMVLPGRARPAITAGTRVFNAPLKDLSFLVGGGSVFTTPRDVFLVMRGLVASQYGATARGMLLRENGLRWNGVTNGYRAFADYHLNDSLTVMFFGNVHTGAIDLLRRDIPRLAAGASIKPPVPEHPASKALSEQVRSRLSGRYDTGGGSSNTLVFVTPGIALFGDRSLSALNDSTFFSHSDYARVVITSAPDGGVQQVEWGPGTWATNNENGPRFPRLR